MASWIAAIGLLAGLAEYPYPFLGPEAKTGIGIAQPPLATLGLFAAVSLIAVAADRLLPTHRPKRT